MSIDTNSLIYIKNLKENAYNEELIKNLVYNDKNKDISLLLKIIDYPIDYFVYTNTIVTELVEIEQLKIFFEYFKKNNTFKKLPIIPTDFIEKILKNLIYANESEYYCIFVYLVDLFSVSELEGVTCGILDEISIKLKNEKNFSLRINKILYEYRDKLMVTLNIIYKMNPTILN